ncbi:type 1 glutamine amidotransferase domain-containing protein [Methylosinus sp. KRF6]|uniref:type 1 glutamine amidotransferase domain-containing protein n=1 Tax=Methylosinus sp. KRF6 TaxID=2846853 RepID=UPI001C0D61ED|nr:type 1 glutamine amidotransferase domain-containing protein [Methylosinus sp. KRF6]MBU3889796.1 type 1 glutamine amidotransferase [Methylosinus sp. KRF6]
MTDGNLNGLSVAILATDGFEQSELLEPRKALERAGASTSVVSPKHDRVRSWKSGNWGAEAPVDTPLAQARPDDFDALLLPGGVMNSDKLRIDEKAIAFTQAFMEAGKPIAAICHGPWTLIETGRMRGRRMTSWPSLRTDAQNAGAEWVDQEAVVDGNVVTSRKPADIPAFNREMVALISQRRKCAA